jgi:hypothetical protein
MEEGRVLLMKSVSDNGRSSIIISLEDGMSRPNQDIIYGPNYNSPTMTYLE